MIRSTDVAQFDQLCIKYLEANTPSYLYRHFRQAAGPQQLAERFSSVQLIEHIDLLMTAQDRDMTHTVLAYACAVALTYRPLREMLEALAPGPRNPPPWFQYIIDSYRATAVSDIAVRREAAFAGPSVIQTTASRSSNNSTSMTPKPVGGRIVSPKPSTAGTIIRDTGHD